MMHPHKLSRYLLMSSYLLEVLTILCVGSKYASIKFCLSQSTTKKSQSNLSTPVSVGCSYIRVYVVYTYAMYNHFVI